MIETPLGAVSFYVNDSLAKYSIQDLPKQSKTFKVDARYSVFIEIPAHRDGYSIVDAVLDTDMEVEGYADTGENLALISFKHEKTVLSIGFVGDRPDHEYVYLNDRIQIRFPNNGAPDIMCCVAWLRMKDPYYEDAFTWFAADPTLCKSK